MTSYRKSLNIFYIDRIDRLDWTLCSVCAVTSHASRSAYQFMGLSGS